MMIIQESVCSKEKHVYIVHSWITVWIRPNTIAWEISMVFTEEKQYSKVTRLNQLQFVTVLHYYMGVVYRYSFNKRHSINT